jgi:hypothetical protein
MMDIAFVLLVWICFVGALMLLLKGCPCQAVVHGAGGSDARLVLSRAGFEARGLMFGAPLAIALGCAFVPLRKPGKLPGERACSRCSSPRQGRPPHSDSLGTG